MKFINVKKKIIVKKKTLKFKKDFEKFTAQTTSFWRFARWAKSQNHKSKKIFKVSNLIQKNSLKETTRIVKSFENKTNIFTKQFFSKIIEADLNNMTNFIYRDVIVKTTSLISKNEIRQIIKKCKLDSVLSSDEISNRILKILIKKLLSFLTNLFQACVEHDYHLLCFREINIITLKKSNKNNYTDFKTYRFIALLNTIDKAFEFIIAHKINTFAKTYECFSRRKWRNDEKKFAKRCWSFSLNKFTRFETWAKTRWLRCWAWTSRMHTIICRENDSCTICAKKKYRIE